MMRRLLKRADKTNGPQLDFLGPARVSFGFLDEFGFGESSAQPKYLRFDRSGSFIEVFCGRASNELGVEFGRWVDFEGKLVEDKFHVSDVLSTLAPEAGFKARTATSQEQLERFVPELAISAKLALEQLERSWSGGLNLVSVAVEHQSDMYQDSMEAERLRARAKDAWRNKDLASVITAYEQIESELGTVGLRESEIKRLSYARKNLKA